LTRSLLRQGVVAGPTDHAGPGDHVAGLDRRVSLRSRRFRSAKYQRPSILAKVSRYRSEATMILRSPSSVMVAPVGAVGVGVEQLAGREPVCGLPSSPAPTIP